MKAIEYPVLTSYYGEVKEFVPKAQSAYVIGESVEDRSHHWSLWKQRCDNVVFACITQQKLSSFVAEINGCEDEYLLRSQEQLSNFVQKLRHQRIYLDITGLSHSTWAPLLRLMLSSDLEIVVVYVEPFDYKPSAIPTEGTIFDLSERIQGISPLPGFISLLEPPEDKVCFVPMLGFEGARFAHLLERVQPLGEKVVPIVGVPGFRPEYPFHTYMGNRHVLKESQSWRKIRFATANCPFSLFYLLRDIHTEYKGHTLKVAPIGTKPHALGAVLYAMSLDKVGPVELVYDHPIRKRGRTEGTDRLLAYDVWKLIRHFGHKNHD